MRISFPEAEARLPWLFLLLDYYSEFDDAVERAIKISHKEIACTKGCGACCRTHKDIPTYPHELVGITWYCVEKLKDPLRAEVIERLSKHEKGQCPFLIENSCSIHPLRPAACRAMNVSGTKCSEGEDAYHTRRQDVIAPSREDMDMALSIILPFYGIDEYDIPEAIERGFITTQITILNECNWQGLAKKMRGQ